MDLPPATYPLLLGPTLLALPFLVARARSRQGRRDVRLVLGGFALVELGLVLLFYDRLLCWPLAAAGSALIATSGAPRLKWRNGAAALAVGTVGGVLFQFSPGDAGLVRYFVLWLPIILALPLVVVASRWLRWDAGRPATWATLGLVSFASLVASSSFAVSFLELFELVHLPALAVSVAGLAWYAIRGQPRVDDARREVTSAETLGEYAARPPSPASGRVPPLLGSSLAVLGIGMALAFAGSGPSWWQTWTSLALGVAAAGLLLTRSPSARLASAALAFAAALLAPTAPMRALDAVGPPVAPYLAVSALAATLALAGAAAAWAHATDARRRLRPETLTAPLDAAAPARFLRHDHAGRLDVAALRAFAAQVEREHASGGLLSLRSSDPLWTVPDDVYRWLNAQTGAARVHVAIVEPDGAHYLPPLWPEEREA